MALSVSNCGDFYLEGSKGFLPTACNDSFYLSPGKKQVLDTAGHDVDGRKDDRGFERTARIFNLSTTSHSLSNSRIYGNTPSPEARQQSFQLMLRMHMNRFNQRLSMLESNTLDIKDSLESMRKENNHFSSQLETLTSVFSPTDRKDQISELAKKFTGIETRLSQLEQRFEILIDGFTVLAQELDKVKHTRHTTHLPQHRKKASARTTTQIPALTTTRMSMSTSRFHMKTIIPKPLPTPSAISTTTQTAQNGLSQINESLTRMQPRLKTIQFGSTRTDNKTHLIPRADNKIHTKSFWRPTVPWNKRLSYFDTSYDTLSNQQKRKALTEVPLISQAKSNAQNVTSQKLHESGPKVNGKTAESHRTGLTRKRDQQSQSLTKVPFISQTRSNGQNVTTQKHQNRGPKVNVKTTESNRTGLTRERDQQSQSLTKVPYILQARTNRQNASSEKHHKSGPKVASKSTKSTVLIKHDPLSPSPSSMQGEKKSATKFQIPPPSLTKIPQFEDSVKSSRKPQKGVNIPQKQSSTSRKIQRNSLLVKPTNISKTSQNVQTRRPSKTKSSKQSQLDVPSNKIRDASDLRSNQAKEITYTTASGQSAGKMRVNSPKPKVKMTTSRKSTQRNKSKSINILDIFIKNNRGQKSKIRRLNQDGNFHIVLGRLAIPIKIIPDY